jgi:hypothetical protein
MTQNRVRVLDAATPGIPRDHGRFNVNGPSGLAAPEWMPDRPGRYLMYFAHHVSEVMRPIEPWEGADEPL